MVSWDLWNLVYWTKYNLTWEQVAASALGQDFVNATKVAGLFIEGICFRIKLNLNSGSYFVPGSASTCDHIVGQGTDLTENSYAFL